jgi:hypothetical protein
MQFLACPCENAVERISDHLGIQVATCCYNLLPHKALSNYLVVDHVAHSK